MLPDAEKLCMIAQDWERDRSFERDDEFLDDMKSTDEAPTLTAKLPRKRPKKNCGAVARTSAKFQESSPWTPLELPDNHAEPMPRDTDWSSTSTHMLYTPPNTPAYFNPNADAFFPIRRSMQDARVFFGSTGHGIYPSAWSTARLIGRPQKLAPFGPSIKCWHQFPNTQRLRLRQTLTPFEAIKAEMFRGQVAREMAMLAEMARVQAEYWTRFDQW